MRLWPVRACLVLLVLALLAGETSGATAAWPSANLRPLVVGWQQFFRVQWDAGASQGQPVVEGYVTNVWNFPAQRVQLLVSGYDASGQRVGQLVAWGPPRINPGARVYFDMPVPPAASYDVAIFAWDWVQRGGPGRNPFFP
jgi:hypothetical protein